jgi:hypothetical protein
VNNNNNQNSNENFSNNQRQPIPGIPSNNEAPPLFIDNEDENDNDNDNERNNNFNNMNRIEIESNINNNNNFQRNLSINNIENKNVQNDRPDTDLFSCACWKAFWKFFKKINLRCIFFTHIILLILIIITLILLSIAISNFNNIDFLYIKQLINNWKTSPINSMKDCNIANQNLSDINININMLNGTFWAGISNGCMCGNILYRRDSCKTIGCKKIFSRQKEEFTKWRNYKICVEKLQENYFDFNIESSSANCPYGTRSCGIIDTENNYLCIDNKKECPVNSIKIINNNNNDNNNNNGLEGNKINMGNYTLYYMKSDLDLISSNPKIPIKFDISQDIPCMNPHFKNVPNPVHILDNYCNRQFCYEFIEDAKSREEYLYTESTGYAPYNPPNNNLLKYDKSYTIIDTYNLNSLYNENNFFSFFEILPYFDKRNYEGNVNLSYKPYIGLKINCLKKIKKEELKEKIFIDFTKMENNLLDNGVITVSYGVLFAALVTYLLFAFFCFCPSEYKLRKTCAILCYIPLGIAFVIPLILVVSSEKNNPTFDSIFSNLDCVDDYTFKAYDRYNLKNQEIRNTTLSSFILVIVVFIGEIVLSCCIFNSENL